MKKGIALLVSLILAIGMMLSCAAAEGSDIPAVPMGMELPDFTCTTVDGAGSFTLSEALETNRAVIINFFRLACPYCVSEFPIFGELAEKYQGRVAVIGLDSSPYDTAEDVLALKKAEKIAIPIAMEPNEVLSSVIPYEGYPCTVIADRFGRLVFYQDYGFMDATAMEEVLSEILKDDYQGGYVKANQYDVIFADEIQADADPAEDYQELFDAQGKELDESLLNRYCVAVVDMEGQPVRDAMVTFCSENQGKCMTGITDENGLAIFRDIPEESYHVTLLMAPQGYSFEGVQEAYTEDHFNIPFAGEEIVFFVQKD